MAASPAVIVETFNQFHNNINTRLDNAVYINGNEMYSGIRLYRQFVNTDSFVECCNFESCLFSCLETKTDGVLERAILVFAFTNCAALVTGLTAASDGTALVVAGKVLTACIALYANVGVLVAQCLDDCIADECRFPADDNLRKCEDDQMCISLEEPVITAPNPDALFHPSTPFFLSEIEYDCVDCPISINPNKDVFSVSIR